MHAAPFFALFLLIPQPSDAPKVGPVPEQLRKDLRLSPFYKKYVDMKGLPLLSSDKVSDAALMEAAYIVNTMLKDREDVRQAIIKNKIRVAVMSPKEQTTDIPEHSDLTPKDYWDKRARGLGATKSRPAISCAEENLLNLKGDRYNKENILVHEFGHTIHELGLNYIDNKFDARLKDVFNKAMTKGLWKGMYSATNHKEYWAEGVQAYFDCMNPQYKAETREKLAKYDPDLFAIVDEVFKKSTWRYVRYDVRNKKK